MIAWRDAMSVGSPVLDADHKQLITLLNRADDWVRGGDWARLGTVLDDLQAYVRDHFAREERIMQAIGYAEADGHAKQHEVLGARARLLTEKFKAAADDEARRAVGEVLVKVLNDWLVDHILKQDMRFKALIPKRPAPARPVTQRSGLPASEPDAEAEAARKARADARDRDVEYQLPPHLAHLLSRIEYVTPEPPPPATGFESFEKFCEAAIFRRVDKVLVFFQRHNPAIPQDLAPFFLSSPDFRDRFQAAVGRLIFPVIWESRQIKVLAASMNWAEEDTESFWDHVTRPLAQCILQGWNEGWDRLRLVETVKDGAKVLQVRDGTKTLRQMLDAGHPPAYDLPRIGNREMGTFRSLLDTNNDWWEHLNRSWRICHDLYEQEKDPRVFQQKAREGAFRDNLLAAFNRFPPEWGDFLALACHRVFPRVTTAFLENFTRSLGQSDAQREAYAPYTMRYLEQARAKPAIAARERADEADWLAQLKDLRDYLANREAGD